MKSIKINMDTFISKYSQKTLFETVRIPFKIHKRITDKNLLFVGK